MRTLSFYSAVVKELLDIPKNADTRDTNAVVKMCSGYLKLLYPHVRSASDISLQEYTSLASKNSVTPLPGSLLRNG